MSLPKCFDLLNLDYFVNIQIQIENVQTATELQDLVNEVYGQISLLESTLQSQLNSLEAMAELIINPVNLPQVLAWIGNFINNFLKPLLNPTIVIPAQLAAVAAQVADLTAAIEAINKAKFPDITIVIPEITIGCEL